MDQRVPFPEMYGRLREFPHLLGLLSTKQVPAEKWLERQYAKTFENWHLLAGWLSVCPQDWEIWFRQRLVDLDNAIDLLETAKVPQISRMAEKVREDSDRSNFKGTLAEISVCVFLTQNSLPYELETSLQGGTNVDMGLFPSSSDALYLEVQYVSESDAEKRTDQISAMYRGLPFSTDYDAAKYRIKLKIHDKVGKFTKDKPTFVVLDCTEIPVHGGDGSLRHSTILEVCNEVFTGKDAGGNPLPYAEHHIDKTIRALVDGVAWFNWSKSNHFLPVDRGLALNPKSPFLGSSSIKEFQVKWCANQ